MKKPAFIKKPTFTTTHAVDLLTVVAFVISYSKLVDLALRAGYFEPIAYAWPLIVDGLALVATRATRSLTGKAHAYAWVLLVGATLVSIVAACASALLPAGPLPREAAAAVFVVTPIFLLAAQHLAQLMRDAVGATAGEVDPVAVDEEVSHPVAATVASDATVGPDLTRRSATHADALFDMPAPEDAQGDASRDEKRHRALHLVATTRMSNRAVARKVGTSEASVRRWVAAAPAASLSAVV